MGGCDLPLGHGGGLLYFFAFADSGSGGLFAGAFLEFLHPAGGIHKFLLAGIKRMALIAELSADFFHGTAGGKNITAGAGYLAIRKKFGMNRFFHKINC